MSDVTPDTGVKKYILIVEDDAFIASLYKINFENKGMDIAIAENGKVALTMLEKRVPDLMLLDLLMPEMDGFECLENIRKKGFTFPVLVMTNLCQELDQSKCMQLGAQGYLVKSETDTKEIWKQVNEYLVKGA